MKLAKVIKTQHRLLQCLIVNQLVNLKTVFKRYRDKLKLKYYKYTYRILDSNNIRT